MNHGGHDALAPQRLCQPVADLGSVGLADLEAVEAAAADQGIVGTANGKMHWTALLLGDLGDQGEPFVGVLFRVGEGNAQSAVVDVPVVEMLDKRRLVRQAELG